jgi:hypothetical protein
MSHFDERAAPNKLDAGEGLKISSLVANLDDESPSLAWRSDLNETLRAESNRLQRRRRVVFWLRPAMGLAFAASLMGVVFLRSVAESPSSNSLEAKLVSEFRAVAASSEVAGPTAVAGVELASSRGGSSDRSQEDEMWNQLVDENAISL